MKTEWDLSPLLKGDDDVAFEEEMKKIQNEADKFISKWKGRNDYLEDAEILAEALKDYEEYNHKNHCKGAYYFNLRFYQDMTNSNVKGKLKKVEEFLKEISNSLLFFSLNLMKISEEKQKQFLEDTRLKEYNHFLERIFISGKFVLSEPEERILRLKSGVSHDNWENMTEELLSKQEREISLTSGKIKKSFSEILGLLESNSQEDISAGINAIRDILSSYEDVAVAEINSILENKKINDKLRGYSRPDESRHVSDDIDTEVVDSLIESVSSKGYDFSKRFYKLKSKLLGKDKIDYGERNMGIKEGSSEEYSYEKSIEIVRKAFSNVDSEFVDEFNKFLDNGQIDVYSKKGKRSGACCTHYGLDEPTYILLNYEKNLRDVTTLAHEVGHGFNNEYMKRKRNSFDFGTPKSTAEVASTFFEEFVLEELMIEANEEERFNLLFESVQDSVQTIVRQVACYKFEQDLHREFREKNHLSKAEIAELFKKNMSDYMGDAVDLSKSGNWWVYWSHIRYFFYVYSYASGLLISKAMQKMVKEDKKNIEKVKEFLASGTSDSPKNIFKKMGIDITSKDFWDSGIAEMEIRFEELERLAKKLGKI